MKRVLLALLLCGGAVALASRIASPVGDGRFGPQSRRDMWRLVNHALGLTPATGGTPAPPAATIMTFRFLQMQGDGGVAYDGTPSITQVGLYDAMLDAGLLVGGEWRVFEMSGSHWADGGTTQWTRVSNGLQTSPAVCPAGPYCGASRLSESGYGTQGIWGESDIAPWNVATSLACFYGSDTATGTNVLSRNGSLGITHHSPSLGYRCQVTNSSSVNVFTNGAARTHGARSLVCCINDNGTIRMNVNGVGNAGTALGTPTMKQVTNATWLPATSSGSAILGELHQLHAGAISSIAPTDEQLLGLYRALTPGAAPGALYGVLLDGGIVPAVFSRASGATCCANADCSQFDVLGVDVPCVTGGALKLRPASINILNDTTDYAYTRLALGSVVGSPLYGKGAVVGPSGASISYMQDDDNAVMEGFTSTGSTSLTRHAFSCWMATDAGTRTANIDIVGTGNSAGNASCSFVLTGSDGWRRKCCVSPAPYAAGLSSTAAHVTIGDGGAEMGVLLVSDCQYEVGSAGECGDYVVAPSYAAAASVAETLLFDFGDGGLALNPSEVSAVVTRAVLDAGVNMRLLTMRQSASDYAAAEILSADMSSLNCTTATADVSNDGGRIDGGANRLSCAFSSTGITACVDADAGGCAAPVGMFDGGMTAQRLYLGYDPDNAGWQFNGSITDVCVSSASGVCR